MAAALAGMFTTGFFWVLNALSQDLKHHPHLGVADIVVDHAFGLALGAGAGVLFQVALGGSNRWAGIAWLWRWLFYFAFWCATVTFVLLQAKNRPTWFVVEALVLACASLTVGALGFRAQEMRDLAGFRPVGSRDQAGLH